MEFMYQKENNVLVATRGRRVLCVLANGLFTENSSLKLEGFQLIDADIAISIVEKNPAGNRWIHKMFHRGWLS